MQREEEEEGKTKRQAYIDKQFLSLCFMLVTFHVNAPAIIHSQKWSFKGGWQNPSEEQMAHCLYKPPSVFFSPFSFCVTWCIRNSFKRMWNASFKTFKTKIFLLCNIAHMPFGDEPTEKKQPENYLLQGQLSVLTLISVSVPARCYRSSTQKIPVILPKVHVVGYS